MSLLSYLYFPGYTFSIFMVLTSLCLLFLSPFLLLFLSPPPPTPPLMHPLLTSWSLTVLPIALVKFKKTSFPPLWQPPTNKWMVCCVVKIKYHSYNILVTVAEHQLELSSVLYQSNMFSWGNNYAWGDQGARGLGIRIRQVMRSGNETMMVWEWDQNGFGMRQWWSRNESREYKQKK